MEIKLQLTEILSGSVFCVTEGIFDKPFEFVCFWLSEISGGHSEKENQSNELQTSFLSEGCKSGA